MPRNPARQEKARQEKTARLITPETNFGDLVPVVQGSRSDFPRRHRPRTATAKPAVTTADTTAAISSPARREPLIHNLLSRNRKEGVAMRWKRPISLTRDGPGR